jgi:hypothetical protein
LLQKKLYHTFPFPEEVLPRKGRKKNKNKKNKKKERKKDNGNHNPIRFLD